MNTMLYIVECLRSILIQAVKTSVHYHHDAIHSSSTASASKPNFCSSTTAGDMRALRGKCWFIASSQNF